MLQYPQGCHLFLFFDLARTFKYQKAQNWAFCSNSADSANLLRIWIRVGVESCADLKANMTMRAVTLLAKYSNG